MMELALKARTLFGAKKRAGFRIGIGVFPNVRIEILNFALVLGIVIFTALYLFMSNNVVMTGYRAKSLERSIDNLKTDIQILNLELTNKRGIGFLEKAVKDFGFVISDSIKYIKVAGSVAKN